jgi:hypothetical protein
MVALVSSARAVAASVSAIAHTQSHDDFVQGLLPVMFGNACHSSVARPAGPGKLG